LSLAAPEYITLYGCDSCPACRAVARKLAAAGWEFDAVKVDIDNPASPANEGLRAVLPGWTGFVPVLDIGGTVVELGQGRLWEAFAPWPVVKEAVCV